MGIVNKLKKLTRWANIWMSQFTACRMKDKRCEIGSNRVVLIKTDAIGDFLIWLDSAAAYAKIYDTSQLTLICNTACRQIAESTGYFDKIITMDVRRFEADNSYRKEFIAGVQNEEYDVLVQTAYSRTVHMDMLAKAIKAHTKIGMEADESKTNLSRYISFKSSKSRLDSIYDKRIKTKDGLEMELLRNSEFIRGLGMEDFLAGMPVLKEQAVDEKILPDGDYYIIFPGASTQKKMWSIEGFAQVADYVCERTGWTAYLCGSKSEKPLYEAFAAAKKEKTKSVDYFGSTSLIELAEVIRHARFVISNDTSGIHFAAAVNTPSVCIMGEYNFGRFLPYTYEKEYDVKPAVMYVCHAGMPCSGCAIGNTCAECRKSIMTNGRYLCLNKVSVDAVKDSVEKILSQYEV